MRAVAVAIKSAAVENTSAPDNHALSSVGLQKPVHVGATGNVDGFIVIDLGLTDIVDAGPEVAHPGIALLRRVGFNRIGKEVKRAVQVVVELDGKLCRMVEGEAQG